MVKVELFRLAALSKPAKKACKTTGQRRWWMKGPNGFVKLPYTPGDQDLKAELDLEPGTYTLGTGPSGKLGYRETIIVGEEVA